MKDVTLTSRQMEILEFVAGFRSGSGYSPTLRETARALGLSSVATVAEHLDALESMGLIRRRRDRARSVTVTRAGASVLSGIGGPEPSGAAVIPLLGLIAAGEPIEALPDAEEITVPSAMASGGRCYALKVTGQSMIDEGIFDGDYVVVEERNVAENGETVVALINGHEATLKKFYREPAEGGWRIRLQPANPAMSPIIPGASDQVEIQGRVRGVLRVMGAGL